MAESRPAALPPAQRTVGQLIAESIRLYGARFWTVLPLGLVYGVSRAFLLVLLHTQGSQTQAVALVLADLVLSPLLFVGAALLYVDQAARTTSPVSDTKVGV